MNRNFIMYTAFVFGVVFLLIGIVRELAEPISPERQYEIIEQRRVSECEIKFGGTEYEKGCNEYFYSINQDVD